MDAKVIKLGLSERFHSRNKSFDFLETHHEGNDMFDSELLGR